MLEYALLGLPYTASSDNVDKIRIQYFAQKNIDVTQELAEERLQGLRAELADVDERLKKRKKSDDSRLADLKSFRTSMVQQMQSTEQIIFKVKAKLRLKGRTIVASGRSLTPQMKTLDYALIDTSSIGNNRLHALSDLSSWEPSLEILVWAL